MGATKDHIPMLDAQRGVAALAVVIFHMPFYFGQNAMPHGYLAVDFFFMLSGYVMSAAYQTRLDANWPTLAFMRIRMIRLYPLCVAGLSLGLIFFIEQRYRGVQTTTLLEAATLYAKGLLFIPSRGVHNFPLDPPLWSLFFELIANLLHAFFLRRRSRSTLYVLTALAAIALFFVSIRFEGLIMGTRMPDLQPAFVRLTFAYLVGVLLQKIRGSKLGNLGGPWPLLAAALLFLPMCSQMKNGLADFLTVAVLFPYVLFLSSESTLKGPTVTVAAFAGRISYPFYILHIPTKLIAASAIESSALRNLALPLQGTLIILTTVAFAYGAERLDARVRKFLTALSQNKAAALFPLHASS